MGTTGFLIAGILLVAGVLAFVLRPLWATARPLALALAAGMAATCAALYVTVGAGLLQPDALAPARTVGSMAEAIAQLEAELARDPRQPEAWRLLGRAYAAEGRTADARDAYARAADLLPDDAAALVDAAEARALAAPQRILDAESVALLQRALALDPTQQRARWFLGIAQRQAGDDAAAAQTWEPLLGMVDAGTAASLRPQIDAARRAAGLPPLPADAVASPSAAATTAGPGLTVEVSVAPALLERVPAGATLFVLARQPGGPPMPVAVEKHAAGPFPVRVVLDDGDSPMPTVALSRLAQVEVVARISLTGDATARPGDLQSGTQLSVTDADAPVALTIDRVVE